MPTPLVQFLVLMLDHRLSGTLLLESAARGRRSIHFHEGAPSKAKVPGVVAPIGQTLLRMGVIDAETLADSLHSARRNKQLQGRHLLERGAEAGAPSNQERSSSEQPRRSPLQR